MTARLSTTIRLKFACLATLAGVFAASVHAAEIPDPRDQIKRFKLPPGFEIQLIASDPDIGQPMNLNFDARGRLWVTSSVEYPYPAQGEGVQPRPARFGTPGKHKPRDRVTVIAGIGPDGKPKSITHFAEGLNIPIGVTPVGDGSSALAYSIPAIFRFDDEDDDGHADEKRELYGRFGNVDTHGMSNAYTRWIDGWIYGCHGFSNQSEIKDAAGRVTKLRSGNTYRFREDGSHFQQFTWGQVNPFGLTFDPLGNLYSADCHSKPLYMLLRGAKYPHFGDKPDGLGFGPELMRHNHGSTGICGPAYYAADHFPQEFHDNLFVCNPVTGRINRDKLQTHGSTYQCVEQPDFVTYDGDLFRPVDLQFGPDGALYIADFCNPVIGHYEAPLNHPDRDRNHGRIWRIIYRGSDGESPPPAMPDLTRLTPEELIELLADKNLTVRTLATNFLIDQHADAARSLSEEALAKSDIATVRAHALWILERLGALGDATLDKYAEDDDRLVRVHATRILAERPRWSELNRHAARLNLFDGDAFVRRAAADALGQHPDAEWVPSLLAAWEDVPPADTHLNHTIRLALRSHVRDPKVVAELMKRDFGPDAAQRLVQIAAAADSEVAAPLLLAHAEPGQIDPTLLRNAVAQIARQGTPEQLHDLIGRLPRWFPEDPQQQLAMLAAAVAGLEQQGIDVQQQSEVREAVEQIAPVLVQRLKSPAAQWTNHAVPELPKSNSPWAVRQRGSHDGKTDGQFWDSIAHGEQLTGILRSQPFTMPKSLTFWMCGHNGHPSTDEPPLNHIRLVDAESGKVLAKEIPPRNDTAQKYQWALEGQTGRQVVIEIVDAHQGAAYAWIAVGRFSPPVVEIPHTEAQQQAITLLELIGRFGLTQHKADLAALVRDRRQPASVQEAALESHAMLVADDQQRILPIQLLRDSDAPHSLKVQAAELLARGRHPEAWQALEEALAQSPADLQRLLAVTFSKSAEGRASLVELIAAGKASARLLQEPSIAEQFNTHGSGEQKRKVADLTRGLPSANEEIDKRIAQHRNNFPASNASPTRGRELFTKHCANCHRIGEAGSVIGPQLDGIGHRGLDRLLEDVLDPNRNVDVNFRSLNIETTSGKVLTGMQRRREGQVLVLADAQGKELRVPLSEIDTQRRTNLSLMPSNFAETLQPNELNDLMAWLLKQKADNAGPTPTP